MSTNVSKSQCSMRIITSSSSPGTVASAPLVTALYTCPNSLSMGPRVLWVDTSYKVLFTIFSGGVQLLFQWTGTSLITGILSPLRVCYRRVYRW
ncbi:hypothetical protein ABKN59_009719 [Abortiporus biennis]